MPTLCLRDSKDKAAMPEPGRRRLLTSLVERCVFDIIQCKMALNNFFAQAGGKEDAAQGVGLHVDQAEKALIAAKEYLSLFKTS